MVEIYRKKFKVQGSEADFKQNLKLSSLFHYLASASTEHAEIIGVGRNVVQSYGAIWVALRVKVEIKRYPKWNENITVETWPEQPNKFDFHRNYIFYDKDDNIIAKALNVWVLIDQESRKLKKSSLISSEFPPLDFPLLNREKVLNCELGKIKSSGNLHKVYEKTVGYSDIDMNEHLNNSKYVDYIMDCFSVEQHKKYFVKSIEVNYVREALPGDSIVLYSDSSDFEQDIIYIEGINKENNLNIFKSQIEMQKLN